MSRIVAVDLETTGRSPDQDRIVEFAFIDVDESLGEVGRWHERVNPGVPIPSEATGFHGIRDEDVQGRPGFAHHAARIQKLAAGAVLLAHNHQFDLPFLHFELVRAGQPGLSVNHPVIDTVTIERFFNSHKLGPTHARYTGAGVAGWHGALGDVEATVEVLRRQVQKNFPRGVPPVDQLLHRAMEGRIWKEIVLPSTRHPELLTSGEIQWLDWGRRLYQGPDTVARFAFGKHRDQPAAQHLDFLEWMLTTDFAPDTKAVAKSIIEAARQAARRSRS